MTPAIPLQIALLAAFVTPVGPPASSSRWDADDAAHLLRRAGFGGTPEQIEYLAQLGRKEAIDYLLSFEKVETKGDEPTITHIPPPRPGNAPGASQEEIENLRNQRRRDDQQQLREVLGWWIEKMVSSPRPLEEKLVLFWHGHFTSGFREVRSSWAMFNQNRLFREHAAGNFRDLLIAVTYDPAMVLYLNTQQNRRDQPNENYARELMELFTLGTGHYNERDIKEAARALTGIIIEPETGDVDLRPRMHDDGVKTVLGVSGRLEPEDVIDIILNRPQTAEFIARKLWTFFAYENPEPYIVKGLAKVFRDNRYELRPLLRAMFLSDAFYGQKARFTHIKSPVELLVGACRVLEIPATDTDALNSALRGMGQQLLQPPNVKGWDGGAAWITASTLFNRYNAIGQLIDGNDNPATRARRAAMRRFVETSLGRENPDAMMAARNPNRFQPAYDPLPVLRVNRIEKPPEIVDHYVRRLLQRDLHPQRLEILLEAYTEELKYRPEEDESRAAAIRVLIRLITSMPEYQLS